MIETKHCTGVPVTSKSYSSMMEIMKESQPDNLVKKHAFHFFGPIIGAKVSTLLKPTWAAVSKSIMNFLEQ